MLISIVTPSFNQCQYIKQALESVRSQSYPSIEHIVVDGASTDGTVDVLRQCSADPKWGHLRWISEPDKGQSDALNKGFKMARGEIVGWLNSDDRYRAGCFEAVATAFRNDHTTDVFYGDYAWIDENDDLIQIRREIEFNYFILLYHRALYIPTTSTFFRSSVFERGHLIDVAFKYAMDYEYFMRLANHGIRFRHLPVLLADFRWQPASKSSLAPHKQRLEQDSVVEQYSPMLRRLSLGIARRSVLTTLRSVAGLRRYAEKLVRGHYLEQWSGNKILRKQSVLSFEDTNTP